MKRLGLVVMTCLSPVACTSGERPGAAVVADSAGIRVVTNTSVDVPEWSLTAEPILALGSVDDGGPEQFYRVGSARRLSDGGIAVYDGGSREVRIFSSLGTHLRSVGGEGEGPGEFGGSGDIRVLPGDSLAVWDDRLRRVTVFDPSGAVVRTRGQLGLGPRSAFVGHYSSARTLFTAPIIVTEDTEFRQRFMRVLLFDSSGQPADSLGQQPSTITGPLDYELFPGMTGVLMGGQLFGETTQIEGDATGYWVGTQKSDEVVRYDLSGRATTIVRWPAADRRVGPDDAEIELNEKLADVGRGNPDAIARLHNAMPVAELFPSHAALMVDRTGAVWAEEFRRPGREGPVAWRVFDADGLLVGTVGVPADLRVLDVGPDYVLGLTTDDLGVQFIHLHGLSRTR